MLLLTATNIYPTQPAETSIYQTFNTYHSSMVNKKKQVFSDKTSQIQSLQSDFNPIRNNWIKEAFKKLTIINATCFHKNNLRITWFWSPQNLPNMFDEKKIYIFSDFFFYEIQASCTIHVFARYEPVQMA